MGLIQIKRIKKILAVRKIERQELNSDATQRPLLDLFEWSVDCM